MDRKPTLGGTLSLGKGIRGAEYHDIGASKMRSYEDRGAFAKVKTRAGLTLFVGIVADGVGGGNLGQRAAELTIQSVLKALRLATGGAEEIPHMLGKAIGYANRVVYRESREDPQKAGMSSTVAVAVVHNRRLYVANVGDSRVYLVRGGKAHQITRDHTYANEKIHQGVLTPEQAYRHPNAEALTRSVGFEAQIVVDLGLYLTGSERGREALKNQGLPLRADDVIVVCSDGLTKSQPHHPTSHFVEPKEIAETVQQYHAEEAAKVLIDLALGRNVDDNVTAVVMEFAGRKVQRKFLTRRSFQVSAVSLALLLVALFLWSRLSHATHQLTRLEQQSTAQAQTARALTATVAAYTPTPTSTPLPPLQAGEIGSLGGRPIRADEPVPIPQNEVLYIYQENPTNPGVIFSLVNGSQVRFDPLQGEIMSFVLFPGTKIFVENGQYRQTRARLSVGGLEFRVEGSCMSLDYTASRQVTVACYEGRCSYLPNYQKPQTIEAGQEVVLSVRGGSIVEGPKRIGISEVRAWVKALRSRLDRGQKVYRCARRWIPTPVPTRVMSPTPEEQGNEGEEPTSTPLPTSTPTPLPPTATPVTPSPTPVTPTPTPVPPTPTPTPTPTAGGGTQNG